MRRGQSTVELALMVPVVCGVIFMIIEFAFYFGGTHYVNYAAFAAARAQQVGQDAEEAAGLLLDGNVTKDATVSANGDSVTVKQPWQADLPFTSMAGDLSYEVTVVAGPDEAEYEGTTGNGKQAKRYGDNQCTGC